MVVLATNKDLRTEIENGNFRADLYDRISPFEFEIPSLRSRKEDIQILINHFIKLYDEQRNEDHSLEEFTATSDCIKALTDFDWPGNVRQLEGVVKKIVKTRGGANDRSPIDGSDLPDWLSISSESEEQVLPKSIQPTDPIKNKYGRLPKDDSILIELKKQGKKGPEVAELYGVRPETVYRRYSEIRKKDQY
jgi:two-component system response regulator HydG